jgi:hypothetical protein
MAMMVQAQPPAAVPPRFEAAGHRRRVEIPVIDNAEKATDN